MNSIKIPNSLASSVYYFHAELHLEAIGVGNIQRREVGW